MKRYYILAVVILVATLFAIFYPSTTTVAPAPPAPPQCDFTCLVEERTISIFERDRLEYLEQSRIKALAEINKQSQEMIYDSPYTETPRP